MGWKPDGRDAEAARCAARQPGAQRAGALQRLQSHDKITGMSRTNRNWQLNDDDLEESIQEELARIRRRFAEFGAPDDDIDVDELHDRSAAPK